MWKYLSLQLKKTVRKRGREGLLDEREKGTSFTPSWRGEMVSYWSLVLRKKGGHFRLLEEKGRLLKKEGFWLFIRRLGWTDVAEEDGLKIKDCLFRRRIDLGKGVLPIGREVQKKEPNFSYEKNHHPEETQNPHTRRKPERGEGTEVLKNEKKRRGTGGGWWRRSDFERGEGLKRLSREEGFGASEEGFTAEGKYLNEEMRGSKKNGKKLWRRKEEAMRYREGIYLLTIKRGPTMGRTTIRRDVDEG